MPTLTITADSVDYTVNAPQYNYKAIVILSLIHSTLLPRGFEIWDNDIANDQRISTFTCKLSATETDTLLSIFADRDKGRGISVILDLGAKNGFFPFGPDRGDSGQFDVRLINIKPGPALEEPWTYFDTELTFVEESNPVYSLPNEVSEGDLQIGSITNLRYPPEFPKSSTEFGFSTQLTYDGTPYTIDKTSNSDVDMSKFTMVCNQSKAAALVDHLSRVVRNANLNIISQANNWIFGNKNGQSGTYICQMLNSKIEIDHTRFDEFSFGLSFYRVSTA